ncbi:MAG: serine protease, partial [Elusimicrobium sp.]|nr:serine protease [Elusimicrobium sp.]
KDETNGAPDNKIELTLRNDDGSPDVKIKINIENGKVVAVERGDSPAPSVMPRLNVNASEIPGAPAAGGVVMKIPEQSASALSPIYWIPPSPEVENKFEQMLPEVKDSKAAEYYADAVNRARFYRAEQIYELTQGLEKEHKAAGGAPQSEAEYIAQYNSLNRMMAQTIAGMPLPDAYYPIRDEAVKALFNRIYRPPYKKYPSLKEALSGFFGPIPTEDLEQYFMYIAEVQNYFTYLANAFFGAFAAAWDGVSVIFGDTNGAQATYNRIMHKITLDENILQERFKTEIFSSVAHEDTHHIIEMFFNGLNDERAKYIFTGYHQGKVNGAWTQFYKQNKNIPNAADTRIFYYDTPQEIAARETQTDFDKYVYENIYGKTRSANAYTLGPVSALIYAAYQTAKTIYNIAAGRQILGALALGGGILSMMQGHPAGGVTAAAFPLAAWLTLKNINPAAADVLPQPAYIFSKTDKTLLQERSLSGIPPEIRKKAEDATFVLLEKIMTVNGLQTEAYANLTLVQFEINGKPEKYLVGSAHSVQDNKALFARSVSEETWGPVMEAELAFRIEDLDLAFFKVPKELDGVEPFKAAASAPREGDRVYSLNFPSGAKTESAGYIKDLYGAHGILSSMRADEGGTCGSAMLNAEGEVIGIRNARKEVPALAEYFGADRNTEFPYDVPVNIISDYINYEINGFDSSRPVYVFGQKAFDIKTSQHVDSGLLSYGDKSQFGGAAHKIMRSLVGKLINNPESLFKDLTNGAPGYKIDLTLNNDDGSPDFKIKINIENGKVTNVNRSDSPAQTNSFVLQNAFVSALLAAAGLGAAISYFSSGISGAENLINFASVIPAFLSFAELSKLPPDNISRKYFDDSYLPITLEEFSQNPTLRVRSKVKDGVIGGTGFVVRRGDNTYIITNYHVVAEGEELSVGINEDSGAPARLVDYALLTQFNSKRDWSNTVDLAALYVPDEDFTNYLSAYKISPTAPKEYDPAFVRGYGNGRFSNVAGNFLPSDDKRLIFSKSLWPGSSGSAYTNKKNDVVGVHWDNFFGGLTVPYEDLRNFVNRLPYTKEQLDAALKAKAESDGQRKADWQKYINKRDGGIGDSITLSPSSEKRQGGG